MTWPTDRQGIDGSSTPLSVHTSTLFPAASFSNSLWPSTDQDEGSLDGRRSFYGLRCSTLRISSNRVLKQHYVHTNGCPGWSVDETMDHHPLFSPTHNQNSPIFPWKHNIFMETVHGFVGHFFSNFQHIYTVSFWIVFPASTEINKLKLIQRGLTHIINLGKKHWKYRETTVYQQYI